VEAIRRGDPHPGLGVPAPRGVRAVPAADVAHALADADAAIVGVSSPGIHWAGRTLAASLPRRIPIAMITKGLEPTSAGVAILPDVVREALPQAVRVHPVAIGGPCIAGELARRRASAVVFAGRDAADVRFLADALATPYYRPAVAAEPVGLCVCSALKNAYATAVGLGAGLLEREGGARGPVAMHNLEAAIFARAAIEMETVVGALGGDRAAALGLAGAGDLFVTTSGGRSSRLGRLLGLGRPLADARAELGNPTLEGVDVAAIFHERLPAGVAADDVRLLRFLGDVLFGGADAARVFEVV
jgi:glycerol-3-phosphate dehydrogenase (NAD(P)+)